MLFIVCIIWSCCAVCGLPGPFQALHTIRERNREINIQVIVKEHYERYMDQEEEYMREQRYRN